MESILSINSLAFNPKHHISRRILVASVFTLALPLVGCPRPGGPGPAGPDTGLDTTSMVQSFSETRTFFSVASLGAAHYAVVGQDLLRFEQEPSGETRHQVVSDIPGGAVLSVAAGSGGQLWVLTAKGLVQQQQEGFKLFESSSLVARAGAPLLVTDSGVWVGTPAGLHRLRDGKWKRFLAGSAVTYLLEDVAGTAVWVGTDGAGVFRLKGESPTPHGPDNGQAVRRVRCIGFTPDGGVMVVGSGDQGERLTFFDGRFWTQYRTSPAARLNWVQQVGTELVLSHGSRLLRLKRAIPLLARPGVKVEPPPVGPVLLEGEVSDDAPAGYPAPYFYSEVLNHWLPPDPTAVVSYARHILVGTEHAGMAHFDGKSVTWFKTHDLFGQAERLRMACTEATCYLPGQGGAAYASIPDGFQRVAVTANPKDRVQAFVRHPSGWLLALTAPAGERALQILRQQGQRFSRVARVELAVKNPTFEVRFVRVGPAGRLWIGLWDTDESGFRVPWGVAVITLPELPPAPGAEATAPTGKTADGKAATDKTATEGKAAEAGKTDEAPAEADKPTADKTAEAAKAAADKTETTAEAAVADTADKSAEDAAAAPPPAMPDEPYGAPASPEAKPEGGVAVIYHRSTLLAEEARAPGSLALPDDIRDVWFDGPITWFATGVGLCRVQNGVVDQFTENDGLASEILYTGVKLPSGTLWVGSFSGAGRLDKDRWYFDFEGPLARSIHAFLLQGQTLWAATSVGVVQRSGDGQVTLWDASRGLGGGSVVDLHLQQRGARRLWLLTEQGVSHLPLP